MDALELAEQFGGNLYAARRRAGMTQEQLAARVSMCRITLSRMETGKRSPRLDLIAKLADATGVQVRDLLYGIA